MLCQSLTQMEPKVACFQSPVLPVPEHGVCCHSQKGRDNPDILPTLHQIPTSPSASSPLWQVPLVDALLVISALHSAFSCILPASATEVCAKSSPHIPSLSKLCLQREKEAVSHCSICWHHKEWEWMEGWVGEQMDGAKETEESLSPNDNF